MLESEKQILRVDMKNLTSRWEPTPYDWKLLGGRGLTSTIINKEVPATANALGEDNKFIVAPGMVTGSNAPTSGRISVGGKSPLTGGIKEANAGGRTPHKLARAGVKALIVENQPSDGDAWYNLILKKNDLQIVQANEYKGMGAYKLIDQLWQRYPNKPGIIGAGVAGQMMLKGAGVFGNNIENSDPGRYAGRGGLGAVLGSKKVIAIVTDDREGEVIKPVNEELFNTGTRKLSEACRGHAVTGDNGGLQNYGTNVLMNVINEAGGLPTKNWSSGYFEGASKISGEVTHEKADQMKEKYGDTGNATYAHPCHPGCIIKCSNAVAREDGSLLVAPLEYETSWALGANCAVADHTDVSELNRICNDLGLDTIEAGNAIGVAMEGGAIPFGDGPAAIEALKQVGTGTPLGRLLGSGAVTVGDAYGVTRVAAVKGQSLPAYDPRPIKGIGVTYATGTMGADHTQGYTIAAEILGVKGEVTDPRALDKAGLSKAFQETTAFLDSSGYCLFIAFAILDVDTGFEGFVESCAGMLGTDWGPGDVTGLGRQYLEQELEFNRNAGLTKAHDRLPEFFKKEPIAPHNVVFDVSDEELDKVHYG
jgi:aldehyde:ferredoxin oxidoreductase